MADQIRHLEESSRLVESSLSGQVSRLKSDIVVTKKTTKEELEKTTAQIHAEREKTKKEMSRALANKADASQALVWSVA